MPLTEPLLDSSISRTSCATSSLIPSQPSAQCLSHQVHPWSSTFGLTDHFAINISSKVSTASSLSAFQCHLL